MEVNGAHQLFGQTFQNIIFRSPKQVWEKLECKWWPNKWSSNHCQINPTVHENITRHPQIPHKCITF